MVWVVARYQPVSLFSLRPSNATKSGGKTLLAPTAFAIKMALLSTTLSIHGLQEGQQRFPAIRALRIALALPEQLVVIKTITSTLRPYHINSSQTREAEIAEALAQGHYPFTRTVGYREWVQFGGPLTLALTGNDAEPPPWLEETLAAINYLGKRGSFLQVEEWPERIATLSSRFTELTRDSTSFPLDGTPQLLDDWGATMTFEHADSYSGTSIALGKERVFRQVVLPYHLVQSGRGYSLYKWLGSSAEVTA